MGNLPELSTFNWLFPNSTSSSVMGNLHELSTFNWLFLKLNQFICDG
jgi:hypothetical protein